MNLSSKKPIITSRRLFALEQLNEKNLLESFSCQIEEYNNYLFHEAIKAQKDQMALTWLYVNAPPGPSLPICRLSPMQ